LHLFSFQGRRVIMTSMKSSEAVLISALIGFIAACLFFAYHAPGATEVDLVDELHLSGADLGSLFTAYSLPNVIMPVFAGIAIDRFGLKLVALVLLVTITLGSILYAMATALSTDKDSIVSIMFAGRFIIGLAAESLVTWSQAACLFWFSGPHEAKAMGTAFAVQNGFGSASSFFVLQWIRREFNSLNVANWSVVLFCLVSCILLFVYAAVEGRYADYLVNEQKHELSLWTCGGGRKAKAARFITTNETEEAPKAAAPVEDGAAKSKCGCLGQLSGLLQKVRAFPAAFWLECMVISFTVTILYTSANFFPQLLVGHYDFETFNAGICSALLYAMTIFAPFAGAFVDSCGRRLVVQSVAICFAIAGFALLYWTSISPWVLVPFVGACFAWIEQNCYTILGRSFEAMDFDAAGLGFGIMGVFLNTGLMTVPPLVGRLGDVCKNGADTCDKDEKNYEVQSLVYVVFLGVGLLFSLGVFVADKNGRLNANASKLNE